MNLKRAFSGIVTAIAMLVLAGPASAQEFSGTVTMSMTSVAVGVGTSSGNGRLVLKDGSEHFFALSGFSLVNVGVSRSTVTGKVYNLLKASDFGGSYRAVDASLAVGVGAGVTRMRNDRGVIIDLTSTEAGVAVSFGPQGFTVTMSNLTNLYSPAPAQR